MRYSLEDVFETISQDDMTKTHAINHYLDTMQPGTQAIRFC